MKRVKKTAFNKALIPIDDTRKTPVELEKIMNLAKIYSEYLVFFILIKPRSSKDKGNDPKLNYLINHLKQIKNTDIRIGVGANTKKKGLMIYEMAKYHNVDVIIFSQYGKVKNKYKSFVDQIIRSINCPVLIIP